MGCVRGQGRDDPGPREDLGLAHTKALRSENHLALVPQFLEENGSYSQSLGRPYAGYRLLELERIVRGLICCPTMDGRPDQAR